MGDVVIGDLDAVNGQQTRKFSLHEVQTDRAVAEDAKGP
jgi:hypothetical protein